MPMERTIVNDMLRDRGFTFGGSLDEDYEIFHHSSENDITVVYMVATTKLGIANVKSLDSAIGLSAHIIIVHGGAVTSSAKGCIDAMIAEGVTIELFSHNELQYNITKHAYVPKHTLKSKDFKVQLLKDLRIAEARLPRIQKNDPVARYFGAANGDLFQIDRVCNDGKVVPYFRIVA